MIARVRTLSGSEGIIFPRSGFCDPVATARGSDTFRIMDHFYRFSEKESSYAMSQGAIDFKLEYLEAQSNLRFSLDLVTTRLETSWEEL